MQWIDRLERMENSVIKRDGTAIDNDYFMATHVPFRNLEFIEFGETESADNISTPIYLSEEQIYEQYIVNRENRHQMIVVRGTNGTGKSHLICWLYNRFIDDRINYDSEREQIVFLRRLDNTIRGAIQQILDKGLVQNQELHEKFQKFCAAASSQDKEEFKLSIYNAYTAKVALDGSGISFKPVQCKDIVSFLQDMRVQNYFMGSEGPIERCYALINSGANVMASDEKIFRAEDFDFPKELVRSIKKESAEEVRGFYIDELRDNDILVTKLVNYLNSFTSGVMQKCANITSENARDLFVGLRQNLYKEGKNLTIFIEDFTSFSIVESELITALAVENGGQYSDLCRVTSVIGITDGYYESFRDNFKNRVMKQIIVTEQAFGGHDFLIEMAARYLNAIYCEPTDIRKWYENRAKQEELPASGFFPDFEWDKVDVCGKELTLYPFNRKSLVDLYDRLKNKSPRYYLVYVIQYLFAQYADGEIYGDNWKFPTLPGYIKGISMNTAYAGNVENSSLSGKNQQRVKVLLSTWGDGTTEARGETIGKIPTAFFAKVNLEDFKGIRVQENVQFQPREETAEKQKERLNGNSQPVKSKGQIEFEKRKRDIEDWFDNKKVLAYSADYNKWIREFVVQAIPWQDEEIPGAFVNERLSRGDFVYIEDANTSIQENRAVVSIKRNPEARTILMGLALFNYYGMWDFEDAAYYQVNLINWVERNKETFKKNILGNFVGSGEQPIVTWCMAAEYLHRLVCGENLKQKEESFLKNLFADIDVRNPQKRINTQWNDVVTFLNNDSPSVKLIRKYMNEGSNSMMGIVGETQNSARCFRTNELYRSMEHLNEKGWDIRDELPDKNDSKIYTQIVKHLFSLYDKIDKIVQREKEIAREELEIFKNIIGGEPTEEGLSELVYSIQEFYSTCNYARERYKSELKMKYDIEPIKYARKVIKLYEALLESVSIEKSMDLLSVYSSNICGDFNEIIEDLKEVEQLANGLEKSRKALIEKVEQVSPLLIENVLSRLEVLSDAVEKLEVMS